MDLEPWLGYGSPADFDSIKEIEDYFDIDNLNTMFPQEGGVSEVDAERAAQETIRQWRESR